MSLLRDMLKKKRKFLPTELKIILWEDVLPFFEILINTDLNSESDLIEWLLKRSEIDAVLEEEKAWLYIRQSCHTDKQELSANFENFIKTIDQPYASINNQLNKKLADYCSIHSFPKKYSVFIRGIQTQIKIFREENVAIQARLDIEEQQYSAITGAMTILHNHSELTLQQAQNLLKNTDRTIRKQAFETIWERRSIDNTALNELFSELIAKRFSMAVNAGYSNYLEYRFAQLGRFDYSIEDCSDFHRAVAKSVVPLQHEIYRLRQQKLGLQLKPYDLEVDPDLKEALKPFKNSGELIDKTIACFIEIDPQFGEFLSIMKENEYLDLESRKGKAPGGYNYPLHESNVPFIFMNATNNLRDLETMVHEGGHAIHSFLSADLELVYFKETPAEIAEVASMAMELISMEHWHHFFGNKEELNRAKRSQLEGVINVLPWVAAIDKFQHWIYSNPQHSSEQRIHAWIEIEEQFGCKLIDWSGYEIYRKHLWQKQIHLYQFPLYYIEYGIAQLGAIAIWRNYLKDPIKAIANYRQALSLGYSVTLPELYKAAGIEFSFSTNYIDELMGFVRTEYEKIVD